jgi:hypothetical protein
LKKAGFFFSNVDILATMRNKNTQAAFNAVFVKDSQFTKRAPDSAFLTGAQFRSPHGFYSVLYRQKLESVKKQRFLPFFTPECGLVLLQTGVYRKHRSASSV